MGCTRGVVSLSQIEPFGWKNESAPDLSAEQLELFGKHIGEYADSKGTGTPVKIFQTPEAQQVNLVSGSVATPDETAGPLVKASRTISISESAFTGDGGYSLSAIYGVTKATAASEGQGIGVYGGALTESSHVGSHSQTDAVGIYGIGVATTTAANSRAGIGGFFSGRRESETAGTTGIEVYSDNQTSKENNFEPTGASLTKGIWLHCGGSANTAVGLQLGFTTRSFQVGIGFNSGSTSAADIRTDSQANFAIRIRGTHAGCAVSVKKGSGVVLLGSETEVAKEATAVLETPFLRINETGWHLNGGTPVAIKAAGAETTAAIWARLKELGLCT